LTDWKARDEQGTDVEIDRSTKSWKRARSVNVSIAQFETFDTHYAVQVGDGDAHAVIYDDGKAWCDCKGHEHNGYCAHVYAVHRHENNEDEHAENNKGLDDYGVTTE